MKPNLALPPKQEGYGPGYGAELVSAYQARSIEVEAAFFYPHLRSGMEVLDCGCGPGRLSYGLAQVVAPGRVNGIDIEPAQVRIADAYRRAQGQANLQYQVASVYQLPFRDRSFDAAFVHALLQHLKDPLAALEEIRRVLKPGGLIGVRDDDKGSLILAPSDAKVDRAVELFKRLLYEDGGDPFIGRRHGQLLRKAGFSRVQSSASVECDGTLPATKKRGALAAALLNQMTERAVQCGWATAAEMKEMAAACRAWGCRVDAFDAVTWCEAIGWKQ